jgi:hypothetical protein
LGKNNETARDTPEDCARVIIRAIEETPPRARYPVTLYAKIGVIARRLLPDGRSMLASGRRLGSTNFLRRC